MFPPSGFTTFRYPKPSTTNAALICGSPVCPLIHLALTWPIPPGESANIQRFANDHFPNPESVLMWPAPSNLSVGMAKVLSISIESMSGQNGSSLLRTSRMCLLRCLSTHARSGSSFRALASDRRRAGQTCSGLEEIDEADRWPASQRRTRREPYSWA
jgi:hypothetical protein